MTRLLVLLSVVNAPIVAAVIVGDPWGWALLVPPAAFGVWAKP